MMISWRGPELRVLLPPDIMNDATPPNTTTASMMPMNIRCLFGFCAGGGKLGLGDMSVGYFPPLAGWVARPIWLMPTRPRTSRTSMIP